jgi:predicted PurR-regulated permease PerM
MKKMETNNFLDKIVNSINNIFGKDTGIWILILIGIALFWVIIEYIKYIFIAILLIVIFNFIKKILKKDKKL